MCVRFSTFGKILSGVLLAAGTGLSSPAMATGGGYAWFIVNGFEVRAYSELESPTIGLQNQVGQVEYKSNGSTHRILVWNKNQSAGSLNYSYILHLRHKTATGGTWQTLTGASGNYTTPQLQPNAIDTLPGGYSHTLSLDPGDYIARCYARAESGGGIADSPHDHNWTQLQPGG